MRARLVLGAMVTVCWLGAPAAAQSPRVPLPSGTCYFEEPAVVQVAVVVRPANLYGNDSPIKPVYVLSRARVGDSVRIYRQVGGWTCGYLTSSDGAGSGWIASSALRSLATAPDPPLSLWLGTWRRYDDVIHIQRQGETGLHVDGEAIYKSRTMRHFGSLTAQSRPQGNRLHLEEGSCKLDLTLAGGFLVIVDHDNGCGGLNVTFGGVWKRRPRR